MLLYRNTLKLSIKSLCVQLIYNSNDAITKIQLTHVLASQRDMYDGNCLKGGKIDQNNSEKVCRL